MSDTEAMMWTVEKDPSLRSDFLNVTILDRPPDLVGLRRKVLRAIDDLPRLRQRVVNAPLRLVPPEWVDDPEFDIEFHVRRMAVPSPGSVRALLDLAATVADQPFDRARPLWEITIVEGLEHDRAALFQKIHHTVIDGVGGVRFSLALLDLERDPNPTGDPGTSDGDAPSASEPPGHDTPFEVLGRALRDSTQRQLDGARRVLSNAGRLTLRPWDAPATVRRLGAAAGSIREQVFVRGTALSPVMTDRSPTHRFDVHTVPLEAVKAAAERLGGTVNDVFVAGVGNGIARYHERMGHPVEELRLAMPVNRRGHDDGIVGNRFAPARVVVPVSAKDPADRFELLRSRLRSVRAEPALDLVDTFAGVVRLLPTSIVVPIARAQARTIDFVASNLRGSPIELYLAGALVESNHPMGPCTGAAVNVTTLSYRGQLDMGINVDLAAVTDPDALVESIREAFDELVTG